MTVFCSASEGWLQVDLIYSGAVVVPLNQNMHGTPDQLKVRRCLRLNQPVLLAHNFCGKTEPITQMLNITWG